MTLNHEILFCGKLLYNYETGLCSNVKELVIVSFFYIFKIRKTSQGFQCRQPTLHALKNKSITPSAPD